MRTQLSDSTEHGQPTRKELVHDIYGCQHARVLLDRRAVFCHAVLMRLGYMTKAVVVLGWNNLVGRGETMVLKSGCNYNGEAKLAAHVSPVRRGTHLDEVLVLLKGLANCDDALKAVEGVDDAGVVWAKRELIHVVRHVEHFGYVMVA